MVVPVVGSNHVTITTMNNLISFLLCTLCSGALSAQTVDIGLFPSQLNDTTLEVYVRPTMDYENVVASFTFTIQWPAASPDLLGTRISACPDAVNPSPTAMVTTGGFHTRTYTAFGTELLSDWGCAWQADQEHLIVSIPVHPHVDPLSQFCISSFDMSPYTGIVYSDPCASVGVAEAESAAQHTVMVVPNPADDELRIVGSSGMILPGVARIFALDGRCVMSAPFGNGTLDVRELATGLYELRMGTTVVRFIKT